MGSGGDRGAEPHAALHWKTALKFCSPTMRRHLIQLPSRHRTSRSLNTLLASTWTCASCRRQSDIRRGFAGDMKEKPYYVTTPIFYVNAGMMSFITLFYYTP